MKMIKMGTLKGFPSAMVVASKAGELPTRPNWPSLVSRSWRRSRRAPKACPSTSAWLSR